MTRNVFVFGLPGCGKSTLTDAIAKKFGMRAVHTSGILRKLQSEAVADIKVDEAQKNVGWWETPEGLEYVKKRMEDYSFDEKLDKMLMEMAEKKNDGVFDSWTLPWLSEHGYKIWLAASKEARARRIAGRNEKSYEEALKRIEDREQLNIPHYKKMYGFEIGKDLSPFHLVLNTENLSAEDVQEIIFAVLEKEFKTK